MTMERGLELVAKLGLASRIIGEGSMHGTASHLTVASDFLGRLAEKWGMDEEGVRSVLLEGADPDEVRIRLRRERRYRRIEEIAGPNLKKEGDCNDKRKVKD